MRRVIILLWFIIAGSRAAEVSPPIKQPLDAIRREKTRDGMPMMAGDELGAPGRHGAFVRNYPIVEALATRQDVVAMLGDSDPAIRLVGAKIAIKRGIYDPPFNDLSRDTSMVLVGPLFDGGEIFRPMKVAEVMEILRNDPTLGLQTDFGSVVVIDYLKEIGTPNGAQLILGCPPEYPKEMARAGITGDITVRLEFRKGVAAPKIDVVGASLREFVGPTLWALSRWRIQAKASKDVMPSGDSEYECRLLFKLRD